MDDATDLTPAQRRLDSDERAVAEALREALDDRSVRPGVLHAVEERAAARHRRRLAGRTGLVALAVAGVVALVAPGGLPLRDGAVEASGASAASGGGAGPELQDGGVADPSAPPSAPPDGGAEGAAPQPDPALVAPGPAGGPWLLSPTLVGFFVPDAVVVQEPAPVDIGADPSGGFCGDAVLAGVTAPAVAWAAAWEQSGPGAGDRDTTVLRETALLWDDAAPGAEAATAYVEATRGTVTGCGDPQDGASYRTFPGYDAGGEVEVIAVSPVAGSELTWRVRAVGAGAGSDGLRDTVVDLDLVILAATAEDAAWIADGVLTITMSTATTDPAAPPEPVEIAP